MTKEIKLPEDTLPRLLEASETADALEVFLNKSLAAGIDISGDKKQLAKNRQKISRIKTAFFPGQ